MDLRFTDEELKFRDKLRHFFQTEIPEKIREKVSAGERLNKEKMVT